MSGTCVDCGDRHGSPLCVISWDRDPPDTYDLVRHFHEQEPETEVLSAGFESVAKARAAEPDVLVRASEVS